MNLPLRTTSDHAPSPPIETRLRDLRDALTSGLVERDLSIRLALLAALAGEHLFLHGPPGTAKSLVARRLRLVFCGATYFERLLTRFTVPEELFGPLSIKGLEEDRYHRLTTGYLPSASVAFLDEIFKANSAILNALLTLLNEREFDNGAERETTPLVSVVAASNELPKGEELGALFDRFLLRLHVGPVSKSGFAHLLQLRGEKSPQIPEALALSKADIDRVRDSAEKVVVPAEVNGLLSELRDWCTAEGIEVSDRRWRKVVKLLQVSAVTNGRREVSVWDAWLLQHCLWNEPGQRERIFAWYGERVGTTRGMDPARLVKLVVSMEARLERDRTEKAQARNAAGKLLYESPKGGTVTSSHGLIHQLRKGEGLFLAPPGTASLDHYNRATPLPERTNKGKGYTRAELEQFHVQDANGRYAEFASWSGAAKYFEAQDNWLTVEGAYAPKIEAMRHKAMYVEHSLKEVASLQRDIEAYQAGLQQHITDLEAHLRAHLWVTSDFVEPAGASLRSTQAQVEKLMTRVEKLKAGFDALPRETKEKDE